MKRMFSLCCALFVAMATWAQSQYITCERSPQQDRIDEEGRSGVVVLAKRADLVITALNATSARVNRKQMDKDGNYTYELIVDPSETENVKVEVSKRGDVNRAHFTVNLSRGSLFAWTVNDKVESPIVLDDQNSYEPNLCADSATVEVVSSFKLKSWISPDLNASVVETHKKGDDKVQVLIINIPISSIQMPQDRIKLLEEKNKELEAKLDNYQGNDKEALFDEWDKCTEELDELKGKWAAAQNIEVYGDKTNRLAISVAKLKPEQKVTYGVLTINSEPLTEAGALLAEGARLFGLRRYDDAKRVYQDAKAAKDFKEEWTPVVNGNIADCDTCIVYTMYANGMLNKYLSWKKNGETISQKQLVDCATGAMEMFQLLSSYNPCDYYTGGIEKMRQQIDKVPLDIKFSVVKWQNDYSKFAETGPMPNVEVWGCFGEAGSASQLIKDEKQFNKFAQKNPGLRQLGASDENGVLELSFQRTDLPTGFFFRPVGYKKKAAIKYVDMSNVMKQSQGDYTKKQFRMRMYVNN